MSQCDWNRESVAALFQQPFFELIYQAHTVHKAHFDPAEMEFCTLYNAKTGACPEDCAYCPQSGHYNTGLKREPLTDIDVVIKNAKIAKKNGAKRFCIGAAYKSPPKKDFPKLLEMVKAIKELEMESCVTLGELDAEQAQALKVAGLDYYNHNLDSSREFYKTIITTRTYQDRLDTLQHVADADINVCCGGILGMGESREDRVQFLLELCKLPQIPKSIPINRLIAIKGTPLENAVPLDDFEFIKSIAATRILFPKTMVRLSAGRETMSDTMQAWCYMAGANSIFIGDKLLTAKNPSKDRDCSLFKRVGINLPDCIDEVQTC